MTRNCETPMVDTFDGLELGVLQQLQDDFARRTGAALIIVDMDGRCVTRPSNFSEVCILVGQTEKGRESCDRSNLERAIRAAETDDPVYHMCQCCGFLDGSVPIIIEGRRVGYWLAGQCNGLGVDRDDLALHARMIGADVDAMLAAYDRMQPITVARFEQILDSLQQLIQHITGNSLVDLPKI